MKLKHLTLNKIVDAAYCCGIANTPVAVLLAAPPGTGKSWSTQSISDNSDVPFVHYITGAMSATSHRKIVMTRAEQTRLIIHDDIGLCSRFEQEQVFSTYMMIIGNEIDFKQYKTIDFARFNTSVMICCTLAYWSGHAQEIQEKGLLDRLLPVVVGLSKETRTAYQQAINIFDDKPAKRIPDTTEQHAPQISFLVEQNVSPRWMRSLAKISQFLSADELMELIRVLDNPMRYEV